MRRRMFTALVTLIALIGSSLLASGAAQAAPPNSRVMAYLNQISGTKTM